jgi:hypothetical protein
MEEIAMRKWAYLALVGLAVACASETGGPINPGASLALCKVQCECQDGEDCDSDTVDSCVDDAKEAQEAAENANCADKYADFIECAASKGDCNDGDFEIKGCDHEYADFNECMTSGAGGSGSTTATTTNTTTATGGDCAYENDGYCDEPEGSGLCPEGSDPADCAGTTSTTNSTSQSTSSTSSGGGGCDNQGDCGDSSTGCIGCALEGNCADELDDCSNSFDCIDFANCIEPCVDQSCFDNCFNSYPTGGDIYNTLLICVICDECYNDCDGAGSGCP